MRIIQVKVVELGPRVCWFIARGLIRPLSTSSLASSPERSVFDVLILSHGLVGSHHDMVGLETALRESFGHDVVVLNLACNEYLWTFLGVELLGRRAARCIADDVLLPYRHASKHVRLSMVGHSFGGLILRSSLRYLEAEGCLDESSVTLVSFVSIATPHLGVRRRLPATPWALVSMLVVPIPHSQIRTSHRRACCISSERQVENACSSMEISHHLYLTAPAMLLPLMLMLILMLGKRNVVSQCS